MWLVFPAAGLAGSLGVWLFLPHEWEIDSALTPLLKVAVFGCLCMAVALFPNGSRHSHLLAVVPFLGFVGFFLLAHVPVLVAIAWLPLDRWLAPLTARAASKVGGRA